MKMSIQELLVQAMNIANKITGVYNMDVTTPDSITLLFKNTKGDKYAVDFKITLEGHEYIKTINFISCFQCDERFSILDYSQEELKMMLERVNK